MANKEDYLKAKTKKEKVDTMIAYLNSLDLSWSSNNENIHIIFYIEDIRFDLWPSTDKMWTTNSLTKKKKTFDYPNKIINAIEEELFY